MGYSLDQFKEDTSLILSQHQGRKSGKEIKGHSATLEEQKRNKQDNILLQAGRQLLNEKERNTKIPIYNGVSSHHERTHRNKLVLLRKKLLTLKKDRENKVMNSILYNNSQIQHQFLAVNKQIEHVGKQIKHLELTLKKAIKHDNSIRKRHPNISSRQRGELSLTHAEQNYGNKPISNDIILQFLAMDKKTPLHQAEYTNKTLEYRLGSNVANLVKRGTLYNQLDGVIEGSKKTEKGWKIGSKGHYKYLQSKPMSCAVFAYTVGIKSGINIPKTASVYNMSQLLRRNQNYRENFSKPHHVKSGDIVMLDRPAEKRRGKNAPPPKHVGIVIGNNLVAHIHPTGDNHTIKVEPLHKFMQYGTGHYRTFHYNA